MNDLPGDLTGKLLKRDVVSPLPTGCAHSCGDLPH